MRLSALLFVCCSACGASGVFGADLGALGPVYPVAEDDFSQVIMQRAQEAKENGSWQQSQEDHRDQLGNGAMVARGGLPRARESRTYTLDPSVTLEKPLRRADGTVLYAAGTRVNPLDYVQYSKRLCFFDAGDRDQLAWVREHCSSPVRDKRIAVAGDVRELEPEFGRVYLDQEGRLVARFKVTELPARVVAKEKLLQVEVIGL